MNNKIIYPKRRHENMEKYLENVKSNLENFEIYLDNSEIIRITSKYSNVESILTPYEMAETIMFSVSKDLGGLELGI